MSNELKFGQDGKRIGSFKNDPVLSIASGSIHILVLTASGNVHGMGANGHGQIGIDGKLVTQLQPVNPLKGKKVTQISTGFQHSVALTSAGQVFSFGRNERGQLGVGHTNLQSSPAQVNIPRVNRIIDIFNLSQHSPLTEGGSTYEEDTIELPLPGTQYHKDYALAFQQPVQQEETQTLPLPQTFSIVGRKPND